METEKVHLTKEKETYLATLYGKALDNRAENPILGDKFADDVVRHIDFDFETDIPSIILAYCHVRAMPFLLTSILIMINGGVISRTQLTKKLTT